MVRQTIIPVLGALGLVAMGNLDAEEITFRFTGSVNQVDVPLGNTVQIGDACTVDVIFDPDAGPVFAGLSRYPVVRSSFTIHAASGDLTASVEAGPQEWIIINDRMGAFQSDQWLWSAPLGDGFGGKLASAQFFSIGEHEIRDYNIHLTDNNASAFSNDALPLTLDLSAFSLRQGFSQFGQAGHDVRFNVEALEVLGGGAAPPDGGGDVARPQIQSYALLEDGRFEIQWDSEAGATYEARWSLDLETWTVAGEATADGELTAYTFPAPDSAAAALFFDVRVRE